MRNYVVIKGLALIIIMYVLYGCRPEGINAPELLLAERIMEEHPDSALTILKQIPDSFYTNDEEQALYGLLLTEAMDKTYAVHTTDSLIALAAQYYEQTDDLEHKAKAWYYWGRVSQDLLYRDKALECYLKAVSYAQEVNNSKLLSLIYNYLGNLYRQLNMYDEAMKNFQSAYSYCKKMNDTLNISYALRDIGRVYLFQKKTECSLVYFNQALELARLIQDRNAEGSILNDIGSAYRQLKNYEKAIEFVLTSLPLREKEEKDASYLSLARLYFRLNNLDSVNFYLNLAERNPDIYIQEGVVYYKYKLALVKEDYEDAIFHNEKYQLMRDSIQKKDQSDEIMRLKYDYEQKIMKKEIERKVARERFVYICFILVLIILAILGGYFHIRIRWSHEQALRLNEKKIQHEKELRLKSAEQIRENLKQIELNKQKLLDKELDLQAAQKELLVYNTKLLKAENELINVKREEFALRDKLFSQTQLGERIRYAGVDSRKKDIPFEPFSMKEYDMLVEKLDELYDNFSIRLKKRFPLLKDRDIEFCCLLKAGAYTRNIAYLIPMTPNAVTKKKKSILSKMELKDISLEEFLLTF